MDQSIMTWSITFQKNHSHHWFLLVETEVAGTLAWIELQGFQSVRGKRFTLSLLWQTLALIGIHTILTFSFDYLSVSSAQRPLISYFCLGMNLIPTACR
jgi:hypothetical protein